jgi:hypothetical protein
MGSGEIKAAQQEPTLYLCRHHGHQAERKAHPKRSERIFRSSRRSRLQLRGKSPVSGVMAVALAPAARILGVAP